MLNRVCCVEREMSDVAFCMLCRLFLVRGRFWCGILYVVQGVLCVQREITIGCLLYIALQQETSLQVDIALISIIQYNTCHRHRRITGYSYWMNSWDEQAEWCPLTIYPKVSTTKHFKSAEKQDMPCCAAISWPGKDTKDTRQKGYTFLRDVKWLVVPC